MNFGCGCTAVCTHTPLGGHGGGVDCRPDSNRSRGNYAGRHRLPEMAPLKIAPGNVATREIYGGVSLIRVMHMAALLDVDY